jgi:hypothetical protein
MGINGIGSSNYFLPGITDFKPLTQGQNGVGERHREIARNYSGDFFAETAELHDPVNALADSGGAMVADNFRYFSQNGTEAPQAPQAGAPPTDPAAAPTDPAAAPIAAPTDPAGASAVPPIPGAEMPQATGESVFGGPFAGAMGGGMSQYDMMLYDQCFQLLSAVIEVSFTAMTDLSMQGVNPGAPGAPAAPTAAPIDPATATPTDPAAAPTDPAAAPTDPAATPEATEEASGENTPAEAPQQAQASVLLEPTAPETPETPAAAPTDPAAPPADPTAAPTDPAAPPADPTAAPTDPAAPPADPTAAAPPPAPPPPNPIAENPKVQAMSKQLQDTYNQAKQSGVRLHSTTDFVVAMALKAGCPQPAMGDPAAAAPPAAAPTDPAAAPTAAPGAAPTDPAAAPTDPAAAPTAAAPPTTAEAPAAPTGEDRPIAA